MARKKKKKKELDESRPGPRFFVLSALLFSGRDAGLLGIEAIRTSPLSMAYAAALATALAATLTVVVRRMSIESPAVVIPDLERTGPDWHKATLFTDPWYQFPAVFCVLILYFRFALEVVATPTSSRAIWFLVGFGAVGLMTALDVAFRESSTNRSGNEDRPDTAPRPDESYVGAVLKDPWFAVPTTSIALLHVARIGLETIEEDPEDWLAKAFVFTPAVLLATLAISRFRAWETPEQIPVVEAPASIGSTGKPDESNT